MPHHRDGRTKGRQSLYCENVIDASGCGLTSLRSYNGQIQLTVIARKGQPLQCAAAPPELPMDDPDRTTVSVLLIHLSLLPVLSLALSA